MSRSRPITTRVPCTKDWIRQRASRKKSLIQWRPLLKLEMILPTLFFFIWGFRFLPLASISRFDTRRRHRPNPTELSENRGERTQTPDYPHNQASSSLFWARGVAVVVTQGPPPSKKTKTRVVALEKFDFSHLVFFEKKEFWQCDRAFSHANPYFSPFELSSSAAAGGGGGGRGGGGGGGRSEGGGTRRSGHPLRWWNNYKAIKRKTKSGRGTKGVKNVSSKKSFSPFFYGEYFMRDGPNCGVCCFSYFCSFVGTVVKGVADLCHPVPFSSFPPPRFPLELEKVRR